MLLCFKCVEKLAAFVGSGVKYVQNVWQTNGQRKKKKKKKERFMGRGITGRVPHTLITYLLISFFIHAQ